MEFTPPPDFDPEQAPLDFQHANGYELDTRFVINDGEKHPCAIVCPGGGYNLVCSFIEGTPIARKLNEKGISAVIVYYRVKEQALFPNPQDDLARAVKEVHDRAEELHLDMSDYSVWGSSAGGHLAASFGTTSMGYGKYGLPKPAAMVLIYPVITLEASLTHMGTRENLLGKDATEEAAREKSIHCNVNENYPDTFIWCGTADSTVPPKNTELMRDALAAAGIRHQCRMYEGVEHGVGPGTGTTAVHWMDEAVQFWLAQKK